MKTWYQVPARGEDPSEEMIDWLAQCEQEWDGDEEGIIIYSPNSSHGDLASPGDWVWRDHETNTYYVITAAQALEDDKLLYELGILT